MSGTIRAGLKRRSRRLSARKLLGAPAVALALAACGEDGGATQASKDEARPQPPKVTGNGIDRAFVTEMVPHHQSAVDMAELAQRHSERPEIKQLVSGDHRRSERRDRAAARPRSAARGRRRRQAAASA